MDAREASYYHVHGTNAVIQKMLAANSSLRNIPDSASQTIDWFVRAAGLEIRRVGQEITIASPAKKDADGPMESSPLFTLSTAADLIQFRELCCEWGQDIAEAEPSGEPNQVADLAGRILEPYRVREGHVRLAGCTFDAKPFLRLSVLNEQDLEVRHHWFDDGCVRVDPSMIQTLSLDNLDATDRRLKPSDGQTINDWVALASRESGDDPLFAATIAWCQWVAGTVSFDFDNGASGSVAFEGWARDWASGQISPPKFRCPVTGHESYEVVALDSKRVSVASAIGTCEQTGTETLADKLAQCTVSGQRVLREELVECPATGDRLLGEHCQSCEWCGRSLSPRTITDGLCVQCRDMAPIDSDAPVLNRLINQAPEFSKLSSWRGWLGSETAVLIGRRWFSERMVVLKIDGESISITRTASRRAISSSWQFD